jgi:hypothetical protein
MPTTTEPPDFRAPIDPGSSPTEADLRAVRSAAFELGRLQGRDDERTRCSAHARRLAAKAFESPIGYPDALALSDAIHAGKAAP